MESLLSSKIQSWLSWFLKGLLLLGFLFLFGRLVELQIIKGDYFRSLADENRIRRVSITAPRGRILARGGEVLVGSKEVKRKVVFSPEKGYQKLEEFTTASQEEIMTEWQRDYPLKEKFGHLSGYLGEVGVEESETIDPECPEKGPRKPGSWTGRTGLEEKYNCLLMGIDGEELIEVDTSGERVRTLGRKEAVPGQDIETSIDYHLQKKVAEVMEDKKGAIVVSDVKGEVLALFSSPAYDPTVFIQRKNSEKIEEILNDADLPLFNRAMSGIFHPGSVFKPVVAIAGLEEGVIDEEYLYDDPGVIEIKEFSYSNWYYSQYGRKEGEIGIVKAISRSTDTFFYKLGELIGIDNLIEWSSKFGLDKKTEIDIPGEVAGLVPSPEWKERVKGEKWFLGNTYHLAIGQGDIALTPLAINTAISAIASQGQLCRPTIKKESDCQDLEIKEGNFEIVKKGMVAACSSGGTAFPFFDFEPQAACKTGTAETGEEDTTHAWLTVFAPVDFPELIATVLVEEGGEGSYDAAPIAREIFDYYFNP